MGTYNYLYDDVQWKRAIVIPNYLNADEFKKEGKEKRLHAFYRKQRFNLNRVIARYPKEFHRISVHLYRREIAWGAEISYRVNPIKPIACLRTEIVQVRGEYSRPKHLDASRSIRLKVVSPHESCECDQQLVLTLFLFFLFSFFYFFFSFLAFSFSLSLSLFFLFLLFPNSFPYCIFPVFFLFLMNTLISPVERARLCILARSLVFASRKFQRLHFARHVRVGYLRRSLVAAFPRRILFRGFMIVL